MVNYTLYTPYNTTGYGQMSGVGDIFYNVNMLSGGLLGGLLLFFAFLMGYVAVKKISQDEQVAFTSGLFSSAFFGALFWFAGWVSWKLAFMPVVLLIIMILYLSLNKE